MRINHYSMKLISVLFVWLMSVAIVAQAAGDPVALLQSIANNMITQLKANKATLKTKPQLVYSLANKYVVPYADLGEMSRRVLPPQVWNSATSNQQAQFQKAFTRLLIRTYASALTSYKNQEIRFYPVRGSANANTVEVSSDIISSESDPVHVVYRLIRVGGNWRLYDMSVEGVSLISSFRSQFADILSRGDMNLLLQRLQSHNTGQRSS